MRYRLIKQYVHAPEGPGPDDAEDADDETVAVDGESDEDGYDGRSCFCWPPGETEDGPGKDKQCGWCQMQEDQAAAEREIIDQQFKPENNPLSMPAEVVASDLQAPVQPDAAQPVPK